MHTKASFNEQYQLDLCANPFLSFFQPFHHKIGFFSLLVIRLALDDGSDDITLYMNTTCAKDKVAMIV